MAAPPASDFKPTRRVRELPGGPRTDIFADEDVPDALSMAPPKAQAEVAAPEIPSSSPAADVSATADEKEEAVESKAAVTGTGIKPSRYARC